MSPSQPPTPDQRRRGIAEQKKITLRADFVVVFLDRSLTPKVPEMAFWLFFWGGAKILQQKTGVLPKVVHLGRATV